MTEGRNPKEAHNGKSQRAIPRQAGVELSYQLWLEAKTAAHEPLATAALGFGDSGFGLRPSFGFRPSVFGFVPRIWWYWQDTPRRFSGRLLAAAWGLEFGGLRRVEPVESELLACCAGSGGAMLQWSDEGGSMGFRRSFEGNQAFFDLGGASATATRLSSDYQAAMAMAPMS